MSDHKFFDPENAILAQGLLQIILNNAFLIRKVDGERDAAVMLMTRDQLSVLESFNFFLDELMTDPIDPETSEKILSPKEDAGNQIDHTPNYQKTYTGLQHIANKLGSIDKESSDIEESGKGINLEQFLRNYPRKSRVYLQSPHRTPAASILEYTSS